MRGRLTVGIARIAALRAAPLLACLGACVRAELVPPPRVVCAGDPVTLRWNARGTTALRTTVLPGGGADALDRVDTVRFLLTAQRFGQSAASAPTEMLVAARRLTRTVGGRTARLGADSVTASITVPDGDAPGVLRIAGVGARTPRPIVVDHGGRSAVVTSAGAPAATFDGLPLSGSWTLRAALAPGEIMGDPAHAPPALLAVAVAATCTGSADSAGAPAGSVR